MKTMTAAIQGKKLRTWAINQKTTMNSVAKKLQLSNGAFYNLMRGASLPRTTTAERLTKITKITGWKTAKLGRRIAK